jgi:hypothetical protein
MASLTSQYLRDTLRGIPPAASAHTRSTRTLRPPDTLTSPFEQLGQTSRHDRREPPTAVSQVHDLPGRGSLARSISELLPQEAAFQSFRHDTEQALPQQPQPLRAHAVKCDG